LFAIFTLIVAGIVVLLRNIYKPEPQTKVYYEHFESPNDWSVSAIRSRINSLRNLKEELLVYSEDVGVLADETCAIMKTVEDKYIKNASQLKNEQDYALPRDEQERMIAQRQKLAKQRFVEQQEMYSAVNGKKPLLECFYASSGDVAAAEAELNRELNEITKILDTASVRAAILKKEKAQMSLGFSLNYLTDALKSVDTEKAEGFYAELSGPALIARADEIIGKANSMKKDLRDLHKLMEKENSMINTLNSRSRKEEKGGNPAARDADMARLAGSF
jgi:hypothetical protein